MHALSRDVHENVSGALACVSLIGNASLLIVISTTKSAALARYSILLASFAILDIAISSIHFAALPAILLTDVGVFAWGIRLLHYETAFGTTGICIFLCAFYETFVLLFFHFVYRYHAICGFEQLKWMGKGAVVFVCTSINILIHSMLTLIMIEMVPSDMNRASLAPLILASNGVDIRASPFPGFIALLYKEKEASTTAIILEVLILCLLITLIIVLSIACAKTIFNAARGTIFQSHSKRKMQMQLLTALIIQSAVPVTLCYGPFVALVGSYLTSISMGSAGDAVLLFTAAFPAIDPFVMLIFIQPYRNRIRKISRRIIPGSTTIPSSVPSIVYS